MTEVDPVLLESWAELIRTIAETLLPPGELAAADQALASLPPGADVRTVVPEHWLSYTQLASVARDLEATARGDPGPREVEAG